MAMAMSAALILGGCNRNSSVSMSDENALLMEENETLREQLAERNEALDSAYEDGRQAAMQNSQLRQEIDSLQREVQDARSRSAAMPAPTVAAAPTNPFEGIPGVTGEVGAGQVTASIESDVLFDAGKATLKRDAKRALDAVASIVNSSYSGQTVRIEGHTDTDPIRKSGHKSNHHLGFERAYAVREYLASRGVASNRMYVASFGPDRAKGSKAASRRVEIAVILN